MRHPHNNPAAEGGFATVSAIILCAAISVVCAGILGVVLTEKRQAERKLFQVQQSEAINTAVMEFSTEIIRAQGEATLTAEKVATSPADQTTIVLRAEYEGRKWPIGKIDDVDESLLEKYTSLTKAEISQAAGPGPIIAKNDCVRTLFSLYGNTDPKKGFPKGIGLIASAGGHDGQVWRIRATTMGSVEERYVRFTGDSAHLFAIISQEHFIKARVPDCTAMKVVP